ncbi:ABC transporter permease [Thermicanus aegyptius]|uniref:ABC transporter permease n=1 Tax=Thermicanus aegyptius TaxID=94009 RepID=UPI00040D5A31|nr:ABC transporter permease subunit [Thermicanus aegyptius]
MKKFHVLIVFLLFLYLVIPLLATLLYSLATDWHNTILPAGYTWDWYRELFTDPRFTEALVRTLIVTSISLLLALSVMLPTIFIVVVYLPHYEPLLKGIVMMPYAIPGVVMAVGLLRFYSSGPLVLNGTIWVLVGAYFVLLLPYLYQGIRNSLATIEVTTLMEAAEILGAGRFQTFRAVIFPNLIPGVLVSTLLSISILFGEFVLANLLVGGHYETIQIYLLRRMGESGHLASAIVITYFLLLLLLSWGMVKFGMGNFAQHALEGEKR